jgi:hypothetical protein
MRDADIHGKSICLPRFHGKKSSLGPESKEESTPEVGHTRIKKEKINFVMSQADFWSRGTGSSTINRRLNHGTPIIWGNPIEEKFPIWTHIYRPHMWFF